MTLPTRHPSEDLILDYARGALEPGRALVVAAHLGACSACRAVVGFAEAIGGALIEEVEPAQMAPDALAKAMAQLDLPPPPPTQALQPPGGWISVPPDVVIASQQARRRAAPGVWVANVTGDPKIGPRSYLLGVGPRIAVPRHTHKGKEFICVLTGAYDDRGQTYVAGDFVENDEDVEHEPRVTRDGECVCLIATDNLLVPRSLAARVFQPFVGI
jgi:putative transcriptional regulator